MAHYITRHEPLTTVLLKNQVTLCAVVPSSSVVQQENLIIWNNKTFTEVRVIETPNKQQRSLEFSRSEEKIGYHNWRVKYMYEHVWIDKYLPVNVFQK
jgi:hypothetical protein